jgi:tetratricopeptide (TPR) repeat protein
MSKLDTVLCTAACVALSATIACGGGASSQMEAKTPEGASAATGPAAAQPLATNQAGQQYATADAPPAPDAAKRPAMNAAAQQAYQAGLQAFQAGDLQGAKTQFQRASDADSNAYQAQFSLGVVNERLGSKSAALAAYRAATGIVKDYEPAIAAYALLLAHTGDVSEAEDYLNRQRAILP